ncbi:hypothetical protein BT67DRAFT_298757 [Trichocladium antarcticum]|uniref:Uncharacterized protein n=1 Tax=Trichocladium antarcticum TaxID=1450529 RepID=A0AAN6UKR4_9PEZI|nr:hypothetical protein BT67DRAFT_298757 [Trichocladium antarcticum]
MAMWPFRRRSRWKRNRANTTDVEESRGRAAESTLPPRSQTEPNVAMMEVAPALQRQSTRKEREPNKLQRPARAYSFSPGRRDSVRAGRRTNTRAKRDTDLSWPNAAGFPQMDDEAVSGLGAVNDDMLWRVPTLHNKRDGDHLPRKKSSKKRRQDDHQREAEIKAMSSFVPVRPATEDWMLGRPMKKETRKVKTGFGSSIKGQEWDKVNRSSDISLPPAESINSTMSSDSDFISYKVSAFEALAPRPTLHYTAHSRLGPCVRDGTGLVRRPSQQQRTKLSTPIPEATLRAHKRIDDIADDLSASDLRELMERDQRRQARKRESDQERLRQRIARRAEKQKAVDAEAQRHGRKSPPNMERGVLGREDVNLGIGPASAIVTSSRIRESADAPKQRNKLTGDENDAIHDGARTHPLAAFHRIDSIPTQAPKAPSEFHERPLPALPTSGSKGSFRTKLSRSKSPRESEARTDLLGPPSKMSEGSSSRGPFSWASFFRWGRNKRNSRGPSSFSNTSRDSMQTTTNPIPVMARHVNSGVPKRTMSRFREDLPELPISPPDSRMQSPEADVIHPVIEASPTAERSISAHSHTGHDTPVSDEAMRQTPSTFSHPDEPGASPEPQSMSLASIDSEASWFSGGLSKKRKSSGIMEQGSNLLRRTPESDNERIAEHDNANEEVYTTDDDYRLRLAPPHGDQSAWNRKPAGETTTGEASPSSDRAEEAHWGSVKGQQPTVVHSRTVGRMKSREGLLKTHGEECDLTLEPVDSSDPSDEGEHESGGLQRATSVNLGKGQARRISVGSTRLLSMISRSSFDAKRASLPPAAGDSR